MDDFIAMSQCTSSTQLNHISRRLLHAIHCVLSPPSISKHRGLDPISIKTLEQGEGLWEFRKIILGWLFDDIERTITLPSEKLNLFAKELKAIYRKKATPPSNVFNSSSENCATLRLVFQRERVYLPHFIQL